MDENDVKTPKKGVGKKVDRWVEIQSRSRKMSVAQFQALAEKKRSEAVELIQVKAIWIF